MSLIQRKPRPLKRDAESFRDDRLFIIACDDTYAPKQYFDFFKISRIQVHVVPTIDGTSSAQHVLKRLLEIERDEDDELWILLDTDHYIQGTHLQSFTACLRDARQQGINIALSRPCFEFWLGLHHLEESSLASVTNAEDAENLLRTALGQYNKRSLDKAHYPLEYVANACIRAKRLDNTVSGGEIPSSNTSRVYLLWQAILSKALLTQLPDELRALRSSE